MFTRRFAPIIGSIAIAITLGFGTTGPVAAQGRQGGGGNFGPRMGGMFPGGMPGGAMSDPTMPDLMGMLQRPDVQRTLALTVRQKDALQELQQKSRGEIQQKMMETLRDMRSLSPEERRAQQADLTAKIRTVISSTMGELDKQTEAILKPEQIARLHELDFQFRGPLAIGDPKLQDKLELTPEQRQKVDETTKDFRAAQMKAVQQAFQGFAANRPPRTNNNDPAANNGNGAAVAPQRPDPAAIQEQLLLAGKEVDKQKKISGDKVLTQLTDAQRLAWQNLQGKPFIFRKLMDPQ